MSTERLITLPELQEAFRRLAAKLSNQGVVGEIYVFGGAAMVLAYKAREATRDVDALFEPRELVHSAAVEVAESLALPRWWLNYQATSYLSRERDDGAAVLADYPNLRVTAISAEHLLAMKALAARSYADLDDIEFLATRLGLTRVDQVEELCATVYPDEPLSERARLAVEDVLQARPHVAHSPERPTSGQPNPPTPHRPTTETFGLSGPMRKVRGPATPGADAAVAGHGRNGSLLHWLFSFLC